MKFTPSIGEENKEFIRNGARYFCSTFKHRASGTAGERDAADYMAGIMDELSDEVKTEDVSYRPAAHNGSLPLSAAFMCLASVLFFFCSRVNGISFLLGAVLFSILSSAVFVYGFLFSKKLADPLFPKGRGRNVYAVRRALETTQNRVILCANLDSSPEWRFSLVLGGRPVNMFLFLFTLCSAAVFALVLIYTVSGAPADSASWESAKSVQLLTNFAFIPAVFFFGKKKGMGGAVHNVSGVFAAAGVFKELSDSSFHYNNTELVCLLTSGGYAGQRGAAAFIKEHSAELKKTKTTVIVLDSLYTACDMSIYTAEECGLLRYPPELERSVLSAISATGSQPAKRSQKAGSTDSSAFLHAGVDAVTLCAVPKRSAMFYPNRFDTAKAINAECIEKAIQTAIEYINSYN